MEEENSLNIVFVGSSEVYNGFVPAKAWDDYGITSYVFGYPANPVSLWGYQLKEIERTQHPDVLVIECNGAKYGEEDLNNPAEVRYMTDDMVFSQNKVQLIKDKGTESTLSYYFPILKYHSHLIPGNGTLSKILLEKRGFNILRGGQARVGLTDVSGEEIDVSGDESVKALNPEAEEALRAFLEECQESEIKHIVFTRFPHVITEDSYSMYQRYNEIGRIVEEYGFDYIDFDDYKGEMGLVVKDDFVDQEHLSANGARKFTDFATSYLMDRYQITPRELSEKATATWEESVDYYDRLYEYWCYYEENYGDIKDEKYDLNDNATSNKYINAYFEGHPIPPGKAE